MAGAAAGVVLWLAGLVLLLPFLAGLASMLSAMEGPGSWLAPVIPVAGSIAVGLQLVLAGVGHVANHVSKTSPVHEPLHAMETALFALTLLPLGTAVAATAVVMLRHGPPLRWAGYPSAAVAIILISNGMMLGTEQVPGFLVFLLWTVVTGVALIIRRVATTGHRITQAAAIPAS